MQDLQLSTILNLCHYCVAIFVSAILFCDIFVSNPEGWKKIFNQIWLNLKYLKHPSIPVSYINENFRFSPTMSANSILEYLIANYF